jgi:phytanoyl-CoA hydroxylase
MFGLFNKRQYQAQKAGDHGALTIEQHAFWNSNGYLKLSGAVSPVERAEIQGEVDRQWTNREGNDHVIDVLSGEFAGKEFRLNVAPLAARGESYKLNNLFGRSNIIRRIALNATIRAALTELLDGEPLICNSLNFERGSQQPFHLDTWYMPPPVEGKMIAAIIAVDNIGPSNGPFTYYPGSHAIPPYYFSHGRPNIIQSEAEHCIRYLNREIEQRGLTPSTLDCNGGDVFLWHANLYHGGAPINDMSLTRTSLVVHYWRKSDIPDTEIRMDGDVAYLSHTLRGEISF